jgi:hypothetical protein
LEAIERAERARQRELESRRGGEFQKELGNFVEEGKLKKSGGVEEVERMRLVKDERARKENHERIVQRERDRAEREANAAMAAAAGPEVGAAQVDGEAGADGGETSAALEVPGDAAADTEGASSRESSFVDAKEEAGTPSGESGPPA